MEIADQIAQKKALIIGELLADIISEENIESLAFPSTFMVNQGGSAANLCGNLKWLGVDAQLIAAVGDDNLGNFLINELHNIGLSHQYITRVTNYQTSLVLVGKNTDTPDFIAYRSADTHIGEIEDHVIASFNLLHTTAFSLSKAPARDNILAAFTKAKQLNKHLSVDWNFAPSIWLGDHGMDVFKQLCLLNPILKISLDDLERFIGKSISINDAIKWLDQINIELICLTCGKDGVWYKNQRQQWKHKPALPIDFVVGVTGAGDAFWSGFIASFIRDRPIDDCIDYALEIARKKIQKPHPLYKK